MKEKQSGINLIYRIIFFLFSNLQYYLAKSQQELDSASDTASTADGNETEDELEYEHEPSNSINVQHAQDLLEEEEGNTSDECDMATTYNPDLTYAEDIEHSADSDSDSCDSELDVMQESGKVIKIDFCILIDFTDDYTDCITRCS